MDDDERRAALPGHFPAASSLTLGPVMFNWSPEIWRDFYFRIADDAPIDIVYIGEVVCTKRQPFLAPMLPEVVARLQQAGKEVVLSTLALNMTRRELHLLRQLAGEVDFLVEANDIAALSLLGGRPHVIGPYINVYNEATLRFLWKKGATRAVLPAELSGAAIATLAQTGLPLEIQIFGRAPLALSVRCYHARAENLHKDGCQFVCERDLDGLGVSTLDGMPFVAVNGLQTLSHGCLELGGHVAEMAAAGVRHFRLSPHSVDMVAISRLYRDLLDQRLDAAELSAALPEIPGGATLIDGFYRGVPGAAGLEGRWA